MHSCDTSKNVKWCHLIWPTLYTATVEGSMQETNADSLFANATILSVVIGIILGLH